MASTRALARTLPRTATNTERHHKTLDGLNRYKFAIFSLVSLDTAGLQSLESSINSSELSTQSSRLAPQPDFSNRSLRDVYDYFISARDEKDTWIHPLYFIVADKAKLAKEGVLVVHLSSSMDEENMVGVGRCGVNMADCWGGNIDIGNQDWIDLKEEEAESLGRENPYDDDDEGSDAGDDDEANATKQAPLTARSGTPFAARAGKMTYGWYSLVFKGERL
jgi:hypothetical protein